MTILHWILYCALPAAAAGLLLVGVLGPRLLGIAMAAAVLAPHALLRALPPWPWELVQRPAGETAGAWTLWGVVAAGLFGSLHDLRLWPRALGLPPALALLLAVPWLASAGQRSGWSFETAAVEFGVAWLAIGAGWFALRTAALSGAGAGMLAAGCICLVGDALLIGVADRTTLAAVGGPAVVLVVAAVSLVWRRQFAAGEGAALALAVAHGLPLLLAFFGGRIGPLVALLALLAPAPLWLATRRPARPGGYGDPVLVTLALLGSATFVTVANLLHAR